MPLFDSGEGANVRIDQQPDLTVEIVSRQRGYLVPRFDSVGMVSEAFETITMRAGPSAFDEPTKNGRPRKVVRH